jgi:sortase A
MRVLLKTEALPPIARWLRLALYVISAGCLGFSVWYMLGGRLEQEALKSRFERTLSGLPPEDVAAGDKDETAQSSGVDPEGPDFAEGEMFGRLDIPRIGLDVVVLNGVAESSLRRGAGHIPGTAVPGVAGNVGIAAHRDTFFRPLRDIRKGDLIQLATLHGQESYRVVWMAVVKPSFVQALNPTPKRSLTLVTCFPFDYVGRAPKRLIVRAELVSGRLNDLGDMSANRPVRFQPEESSASHAR